MMYYEERIVDSVREKILNNPTRDVKSLEFTNEEYEAMKQELEAFGDVTLTANTKEEILEVFIKLTLYKAINGEEYFYYDTGVESYIYDWAKALYQLYN